MTKKGSESHGAGDAFSPGTARIFRIEREDAFGDPSNLLPVGRFEGVFVSLGPDNRLLTVSNGEGEVFAGEHHYQDIADGCFRYDCFRLEDEKTGLWGKYRVEFFYQREQDESGGGEPPAD